MKTDSHVQAIEFDLSTDLSDDIDHVQGHSDHSDSLVAGISVVRVDEAEHDVAISDGVDLIKALLHARFVKLGEQRGQHLNDFLRLDTCRVVSESLDISIQDGHIMEDVTEL